MITEDDLMALKDRIRTIMSEMEGPERGKQTRLAAAAGVERQVVSNWLSGAASEMRYESAKNLEDALGYCVEWLMRGKGARKKSAAPMEGEMFSTFVTLDENRLLTRFRAATPMGKQLILMAADGAPRANPPSGEPEEGED